MPNAYLNELFDTWREQGLMVATSDVRLMPRLSNVTASKISFASRFSRNIGMVIPISAAAMDTVCEADMAIEIASLGGIGVIHRKLPPKVQASHVARTKFALNHFIDKPITISSKQSVQSVLEMIAKKGYKHHNYPVTDSAGKLEGLVTGRDFDVCPDNSLPVGKIMTPFSKLVVAPVGTTIEEAHRIFLRSKVKLLPVVDSHRRLRRIYLRADVMRAFDRTDRHNVDKFGRLRVAAAIGDTPSERKRALLLVEKGVDAVVIDMAHAHTDRARKQVIWCKKNLPVDTVVGNICTGEAAKYLANAGADGLKVGHGPGSICNTRIIAGTGVTQLTAVEDCVRAVEGMHIPVIADGGIRYSGDIPILLGVGAQSVMMGSILAGTDEAPGAMITTAQGKKVKNYRGMGWVGSQDSLSPTVSDRYRRRGIPADEIVSEGVPGVVPYKGPVRKVIGQLIGGMRSGFATVGANNLAELQEKAHFMRMTSAGLAESHVHGIQVTELPANYN